METAVLDTPTREKPSLAGRFENRLVEQGAQFAGQLELGFAELVQWESQRLDLRPTVETLLEHRRAIEEMRLFARLIEIVLSHPDFPDRSLAQRVHTVAEALDDHLAMWHRPLSPTRRAEVLKGCFNES